MSTYSKESKLQILALYLACCTSSHLYRLKMPVSKKATAKKIVGPIFSYMRRPKQERHIRSFLNPVREEQNKTNTQPPNAPPTHQEATTNFPLNPFPLLDFPRPLPLRCNISVYYLPPYKTYLPTLKLPPREVKSAKKWGEEVKKTYGMYA